MIALSQKSKLTYLGLLVIFLAGYYFRYRALPPGSSEIDFLALAAGSFSIIAAFLLTRKLYSRSVALVAALFIATSPTIIYGSLISLRESLFLTTTLLLCLAYLNTQEPAPRKELFIFTLLAALLAGLHDLGLLILLTVIAYDLLRTLVLKLTHSWAYNGRSSLTLCILALATGFIGRWLSLLIIGQAQLPEGFQCFQELQSELLFVLVPHSLLETLAQPWLFLAIPAALIAIALTKTFTRYGNKETFLIIALLIASSALLLQNLGASGDCIEDVKIIVLLQALALILIAYGIISICKIRRYSAVGLILLVFSIACWFLQVSPELLKLAQGAS